MNVDGTTTGVDQTARRAAVLGSPIEHSLSPVLHGAAYQALDLRGWHYDKIECHEAGLPGLVDSMGPEWAGLSLTMPLKRVALTVADTVSPLAEAVGAANTLVFPAAGPAGGRQAHNTDVAGMVAALQEAGLRVPEDISVVGFDDIQIAVHNMPSLSTVRQPLQKMGELAARTLLDRIEGKDEFVPEMTVEPELVVRRSTGRAPLIPLISRIQTIA